MRRRALTLFFISLCLCATVAPSAAQEKGLTGEEIVNRHLEAAGGREALARFRTRVATGTVKKENEPEGKLWVVSEAPDRLSAAYGFRDYTLYMTYDGNSANIRPTLPRNVAGLTDKYLEMLGSGLMFNGISLYNLLSAAEPGALRLEAKGTKKVDGRPAHVVQLRPPKGAAVRLYFDAETFMWVRTDFGKASLSKQMGAFTNDVVNQGGGELTVDFYVKTSDFRDVDGVKLPFRFEQVMTSPILRQTAVGAVVGAITKYQHDIKLDPGTFR